jgi:sterol 3beta-glucosyltransferase
MDKGHLALIAAPENFKDFVEGFGVPFHPLYGNAEEWMNAPEGQRILKTENPIKLMKYFFKVLRGAKVPLRESYIAGVDKVDAIVANAATLTIVSAIAEKQRKKVALTYFMPPVVVTGEFPLNDLDWFNFPWYNKLTFRVAHFFYWKFVRKETNEFRRELGQPELRENLIRHLDRQKPLDLYCISPSLIPQPKDWESNHKITGFLTVPAAHREETPRGLTEWLDAGERPLYIGFGSNGVGNTEKFIGIIRAILERTGERILFATGWSVFQDLPVHPNLFVAKYVNHEAVLPKCKVGIFHGGAGTLATMLRNGLPVVIISFYTDQPTWGKIVVRRKLGAHIPAKKVTVERLLAALASVQTDEVRANVLAVGREIVREDGVGRAVRELEEYFLF